MRDPLLEEQHRLGNKLPFAAVNNAAVGPLLRPVHAQRVQVGVGPLATEGFACPPFRPLEVHGVEVSVLPHHR